MITTLNEIRAYHPCKDGWTRLLAYLGKTVADDEPLPLLTVLESNGLDDTLWCFRALRPEYASKARLIVCDLVEPALQYTDDPRPARALEMARAHAHGKATDADLADARDAAYDAAHADTDAAGYAAAYAAGYAAANAESSNAAAAAAAYAAANAEAARAASAIPTARAAGAADAHAEQTEIVRKALS